MKSLEQNKQPTMLVILDGFGYRQHNEYNAIACADTPFLDYALHTYPHTLLKASGAAVGLPDGVVGNSEVGHQTIGTGSITKQPLTILNEEIAHKTLCQNNVLQAAFSKIVELNKTVHLAGIVSNGGVHGHINHLFALINCALTSGVERIIVHAFLDGRDTGPQTAAMYLQLLQHKIDNHKKIILGSVHGRFYAMDRDRNWDRTKKSYDVLTKKQPITFDSWRSVLDHYYQQGIFDEHIPPTQLSDHGVINNGDGLIFFDYRPERERQLASALRNPDFSHFQTTPLDLTFFITPVSYGENIDTTPLLPQPQPSETLKEQLSSRHKTMFTIAETEKYAHVTYFFDGGREAMYHGEQRVLIPSIKTDNFADYPCMSAQEITSSLLHSLITNACDFYLVNFANADMVGHTGDFKATIKAVECLDTQLKKLYEQVVVAMNGTLYITSDHGKAEDMFDTTINQSRTAHTAHHVPFIMVKKGLSPHMTLPLKELSDISSFILAHIT
jgi:2,3-bisphosphoglycerate-independent phosphoglycerate mutase